ncbi:MAG TPA: pyridoxamine kinase [Clostridia bacterium]|nr:pyridoxamine kinase [Clostridia bacterium]
MKRQIKRVAAIHDLSGFGRTSLAVVIPILSTMGMQVCSLPTAVLSTHTGGFEGYTFVDLTEFMDKSINHWKELGIEFDCIYSGFLGSPQQIDIISRFIDDFSGNDPLIVVDPAMGDNGRLYSTMTGEMVVRMRHLITKADIITPNFTEAAFLLDEPYRTGITLEEMKDWLVRLSDMGPQISIITSVPYRGSKYPKHQTSVIAYNREDGRFWKVTCEYIPAHYPGAGDTFTSVLTGSLLQGDSLPLAMDRSVQFITTAIRASYGSQYPEREGVLLERVLGVLNLPVVSSSYEVL